MSINGATDPHRYPNYQGSGNWDDAASQTGVNPPSEAHDLSGTVLKDTEAFRTSLCGPLYTFDALCVVSWYWPRGDAAMDG